MTTSAYVDGWRSRHDIGPATDSVWMPIGDQVVAVLLDSDVWAARACEAVGRDFTQTEWDLYVPGDLPLTRFCGERT